MTKTLVTAFFVVLALLLSTSWDLLAVKILLTGCLMGWLARTVVANIKEKNRKAEVRRNKRLRRMAADHAAREEGRVSVNEH
ncbi:hypothetical protein [uncultured Megasphaera sp.]|uniref:hypothetical protein n=1 Tax=uncultured Megasphaera sp. TaxID=165188 RepID=UPI0025F0521A|nr:hypothetical protein [uncultured Megasphaera sp.]